MRTIGLVGGTSWVSTIEYYRIINSEVNARLGGSHSARILLFSVEFGEVRALEAAGDLDGVGSMLAGAASTLAAAGAACVLLCANTTHMHAPRVQAAVSVPLVHLIDATAREIRRQKIAKIGLLGTKLTMELDFYVNRLKGAGIDVIVPDAAERAFIQHTIETELTKSVFTAETRERYLGIIRSLASRGAEGVILGCTEIPLLVPADQCPVPAFDTTRLHALAAVDFALAG
jgi:aspartate racemase